VKNTQQNSGLLSSVSLIAVMASGFLMAGAAQAQTTPPTAEPAADSQASEVEEVVVTGIRASLRRALDTKRNSNVMVDAINAEDIADFPDANLAESLQRLPGVSIDRDNGEGRTISVRGLGGDFTRVRLNGLETLSTAGSNDSGSSPNRGRGFDFSTFASELFSSLKVQKTASAETDEGALGATVDLVSGRPFNFPGRRFGLSVQDAYYANGETNNPRVAGSSARSPITSATRSATATSAVRGRATTPTAAPPSRAPAPRPDRNTRASHVPSARRFPTSPTPMPWP
jgi:TonB-dependent receptor